MGIVTSIVVVGIGAILRFAVTANNPDFNIRTVGAVMMIVGAVGFVVSVIYELAYGSRGWGIFRSRTTVTRSQVDPVVPVTRTVVTRDDGSVVTTAQRAATPATVVTRTEQDYA